MTEPIELRPVVLWFAQQMELKLRENDHKGGWHEDDPWSLSHRVLEEADELSEAVEPESVAGRSARISEAVDVANMALMVADHFRENGPSKDQGRTL